MRLSGTDKLKSILHFKSFVEKNKLEMKKHDLVIIRGGSGMGFWDFYPKKSQILKSQNPGIFWDRDRFFWDIPGFFKISKTLCKMLNYMLYFSDRFFFVGDSFIPNFSG